MTSSISSSSLTNAQTLEELTAAIDRAIRLGVSDDGDQFGLKRRSQLGSEMKDESANATKGKDGSREERPRSPTEDRNEDLLPKSFEAAPIPFPMFPSPSANAHVPLRVERVEEDPNLSLDAEELEYVVIESPPLGSASSPSSRPIPPRKSSTSSTTSSGSSSGHAARRWTASRKSSLVESIISSKPRLVRRASSLVSLRKDSISSPIPSPTSSLQPGSQPHPSNASSSSTARSRSPLNPNFPLSHHQSNQSASNLLLGEPSTSVLPSSQQQQHYVSEPSQPLPPKEPAYPVGTIRPWPSAMMYKDVKGMRTCGERAVGYAKKTRELQRSDTGLRAWVRVAHGLDGMFLLYNDLIFYVADTFNT
jgi:hypothetical protein